MHLSSIAITLGLIGSGVFAWTFSARSLVENPDLDVPLNPLGINRSPYGEVFAMAMQSPIESYFHAGMGQTSHQHAPGEECSDECSEPEEKHEHDENCEHDHDNNDSDPALVAAKKAPPINVRWLKLITSLSQASEIRTNPKPASEAHKRHLRRETEDKLRFAYELDPSHYANYNSLHFFLTVGLTTRPELTPSAGKLAEETIQYCLKQENDPRPALTAAAACTNILHLMFEERSTPPKQKIPFRMPENHGNKSYKYTTAQMRQCLDLLDHCLARYNTIAKQWDESKNWDLLSPMRITECQDRLHFISKIREAAEKTILRHESESNPTLPTS